MFFILFSFCNATYLLCCDKSLLFECSVARVRAFYSIELLNLWVVLKQDSHVKAIKTGCPLHWLGGAFFLYNLCQIKLTLIMCNGPRRIDVAVLVAGGRPVGDV